MIKSSLLIEFTKRKIIGLFIFKRLFSSNLKRVGGAKYGSLLPLVANFDKQCYVQTWRQAVGHFGAAPPITASALQARSVPPQAKIVPRKKVKGPVPLKRILGPVFPKVLLVPPKRE